jgi:hypothetical protein
VLRSRAARAWRGASAAAVATFAAAVSHSAADGHPAPLLGVVIALALALPVCVLLAGKRLSWLRLALAVGVSQFAFHALLLIGVGEATGAVYAPMPGMAGHAGHIVQLAASTASMPAMEPHGAGMWMAHGIAAITTILAIGRGELAVRALLQLTGWRRALRLLHWRPAPAPRRVPLADVRTRAALPAPVLSAVRRRGPPLAA